MKEYPEFTQGLAPVAANQTGGEIVLNAEDAVLVQQIHGNRHQRTRRHLF